jgi:hypothetical protein
MRKFQWRRLTRLSGLVVVGAVLALIGVVIVFAGHTIGVFVAGFGVSLILSKGYFRGEWFRNPPSDDE